MKEIRSIESGNSRGTPTASNEESDGNLYDAAQIAFYALDRQGRIREVNQRGAELLGFTAEWLIGRVFFVFVARQDVRRFLEFLTHSLRAPAESQVIDVDLYSGAMTFPIRISMTTSVGESVCHRLAVADMTDVRRTEKLLDESMQKWYSVVNYAPETIMSVEPGGRIVFVNKPIWGYSAEALVGANILDYLAESDKSKVFQCLHQAFSHRKRISCEVNGVNGDVNQWHNFTFGPPHRNKLGKAPTTTLLIQEISESKKKEELLRASGEQMRDFAARIDAAREDERTRVAREIHDELGQALTVLKLELSWIRRKMPTKAVTRKKVNDMIVHVDETIRKVRRISEELRPSILDELGLGPALEWQLSEFRKRTKIRTEIVSNADELRLSAETAAAVFRVVQEALTNVIRHAKATRVQMTLRLQNEMLMVSIQDNGKGMPRKPNGLKSLGIVGMQERISRIGGQFDIFSEPGEGTRLDILIPTNK